MYLSLSQHKHRTHSLNFKDKSEHIFLRLIAKIYLIVSIHSLAPTGHYKNTHSSNV